MNGVSTALLIPGLFHLSPTVFHIEIDINLLQGDSHAWGFSIGEHDKLDIGWRFEVMQLVLASPVANKARNPVIVSHQHHPH
jgi:hypothetical protein